MITRVKTFVRPLSFARGPSGAYTVQLDGEGSLEDDVNEWLTQLEVKPVSVSPPSITMLGRDEKHNLHMAISVSLLYQAEETISDEPAAVRDKFESGGFDKLFASVQSQLPAGVDLGSVVRVVGPADAASLGLDPATIGRPTRRPAGESGGVSAPPPAERDDAGRPGLAPGADS